MEEKTVRVTINVLVEDGRWGDRQSREFKVVGDVEAVRSVTGNHVVIGAATVALIESTMNDYMAKASETD
jgi:hypothetical protein